MRYVSPLKHGPFVAGFSLVEVVLSLGIVSFALVPLLGILPIGLGVSRSAVDLTLTAQIGQRMVSMIEQTGYSSYASLETSYYYFDDEGQPVTVAAGAAPPANAIYTASIVQAQTAKNSLITADASTANTMACLQINIVTDPGHFLSSSASPVQTVPANLQSHSTTIPVFLANNGS